MFIRHRAAVALSLLSLFFTSCQTPRRSAQQTGPWNLADLQRAPAVTWGSVTGAVQELYYQGEPFNGKPTRVFAYLGRPNVPGNSNPQRRSGVVLVHGGGGKAFKEWAEHWANRGYVALAMDLSGHGPNGRLPDGGPDQSDTSKFREFTAADAKEMWTYHAAANVIRAGSLLASLPEVDPDRIALTGISWGGYLTCIVAGLDHRFKAAVPVYGCGYLGENSVWKDGSLARLSPETRALWLKTFDPSEYLPGVRCPILFLNGTHDFAYPLDSYQKSYRLVRPSLRHVSIVPNLPHGHIWSFPEVDQFIDRALNNQSFPEIGPLKMQGRTVQTRSTAPMQSAALHFTTNTGPWQKREWSVLPATINGRKIEAQLPTFQSASLPIVFFISATNQTGLRFSSEFIEH